LTKDWPTYNEALVKRGTILLDLSLLQDWKQELGKMNQGKEGARYRYPETLIRLQALLRSVFGLPYRQLQGFTTALARWEPALTVPCYSTTCRRLNDLEVQLDPVIDPGKPVTIAIDSSGIKVGDRGEWMRQKWRRRRGFLKIHLAVDVDSKQIVALVVSDERTGDAPVLVPLVEQAEKHCRVARAIGDGAYDSRSNFNYLDERGIEPVIKVRRNSSTRARGSPARRRAVLEQLEDPDEWKRRTGYGCRWMVETAFSVFKRVFGESVAAKSFRGMVQEIMIKASVYNMFMRLNPTT
jgi:IS5 family transposase